MRRALPFGGVSSYSLPRCIPSSMYERYSRFSRRSMAVAVRTASVRRESPSGKLCVKLSVFDMSPKCVQRCNHRF